MELQISQFKAISEQGQKDIINLIKIGNEANAELILERLENSMFTACLQQENRVIGTATIKRPELSYRTYVFNQAAIKLPPENITLELGYIFIEKEFRAQGYALSICQALLGKIQNEPIFATTREDNLSMQSILKKNQFIPEGKMYKNRAKTKFLQLFVRNRHIQNYINPLP